MVKELLVNAVYNRVFHAISFAFDIFSITYFIVQAFFLEAPIFPLEFVLGAYFLIEYVLLFLTSEDKWQYVKHPLSISNVIIIIGYILAPFYNFGFLRIIRALRVIHLYQLIPDIRMFTSRLLIWEKVGAVAVHLLVLIFIMTEIIYILQANINEQINSRFDAFYFTVNSVAKIGDGITLVGTQGKILSLIITIISISLFIQLIELLRKTKEISTEMKSRRFTKKDMKEIYTEQLCTFCDVKNRASIRKEIDS